MTSIVQAVDRMKEDLDKAFAGKPLPERVKELKRRLEALREDMEVKPGIQVTPIGKLNMYTRLREILVLFKEVMVPVLVELEKQRLDIVKQMALAQGAT